MEERLAETDGRSADGFESRPRRVVGERDAGPTGGGAVEVGGGGEEKRAMLAVPGEALDGNGGAIDLNDIEGVEFAATAGGGGCTGMDDERGMAGDFVTRGAFAGTADMQMAGARKTGHGHVRSSDQTVKLAGSRQIEGMVGDNETRAMLAARFEPGATAGDLPAVDAATLKGERPGGIDADDGDFVIGVEGLKVGGDVALVVAKGFQGAGENVLQGHVVIARNDNLW